MKIDARITRLVILIFWGLSSLMLTANVLAEDTAPGLAKNIMITFCRTPDGACEDLMLFADAPTTLPGTTSSITWRVDAAIAALNTDDK